MAEEVLKIEIAQNHQTHIEILSEARRQELTRIVCWSICIGFALLDTWSRRYFENPDGISYLDMSDALLLQKWHLLVNPWWSPLYPFLIGVARWVFRPTPNWELPFVHLVNLGIFIGALAAFEFFLGQVVNISRPKDESKGTESTFPLPAWVVRLIGYSLFAWGTFVLGRGLSLITPDLCVAAFVYLDAGIVLRLSASPKKLPMFLLLGLTLGVGYYAKAALFPIAFVFMVVAFVVACRWRRATLYSLPMLIVFGIIVSPLLLSVSKSAGHFTFGESGTMNYAWGVGGVKMWPFYSAVPPSSLKHPLHQIHHVPDVFEFGVPFNTTYPLWFDISYWDAGIKARTNVGGQLRVIARSLIAYYAFLVRAMWGQVVCYLVLLFMGLDRSGGLRKIGRGWPLIIPGIAGLFMYSLVLVETRYIAPFAVLVWAGLFPGLYLKKTNEAIKLATVAGLVFSSLTLVMVVEYYVYSLAKPPAVNDVSWNGERYYPVAEFLRSKSLQPGQAVAVIGTGTEGSMWARLARLRIVAQIPSEDVNDFWNASAASKEEVFGAIAKTGARAVVSEEAPPSSEFANWQRIGDSQYYVHFLMLPEGK